MGLLHVWRIAVFYLERFSTNIIYTLESSKRVPFISSVQEYASASCKQSTTIPLTYFKKEQIYICHADLISIDSFFSDSRTDELQKDRSWGGMKIQHWLRGTRVHRFLNVMTPLGFTNIVWQHGAISIMHIPCPFTCGNYWLYNL